MISRTVRYFKLLYIVAGILMSNEVICETVDQIQIAPRATAKQTAARPPRISHVSSSGSGSSQRTTRRVHETRCWWAFDRLDIFGLSRIKRRLMLLLGAFSIWTIPNYLFDRSTHYISQRFLLNSDCDLIYNK